MSAPCPSVPKASETTCAHQALGADLGAATPRAFCARKTVTVLHGARWLSEQLTEKACESGLATD